MTIFFSEHAIDELEKHEITEDEARVCLQYGDLVIKQVVKGEIRYGKANERKYDLLCEM